MHTFHCACGQCSRVIEIQDKKARLKDTLLEIDRVYDLSDLSVRESGSADIGAWTFLFKKQDMPRLKKLLGKE